MAKLYLGTQEVTLAIKVEVDKPQVKYGFTVDNFLGDLDANGKIQPSTGTVGDTVLRGVRDVADYALAYKFYHNLNLTHEISFTDLETVSGSYGCYHTFNGCTNLTSVSLPNLITISGFNGCYGMFYNCTNLTSASFPNLTTISGGYGGYGILQSCTNLTSVSFPSLTTISGMYGCSYLLGSCSSLTTVSFPSLTTISGSYCCYYMFQLCTNIESISFPALTTSSFGSNTTQFSSMMQSTGTSKTHTIHFPSNLQSKISTLSGYPLFGGTSGYVTLAFDLPATS